MKLLSLAMAMAMALFACADTVAEPDARTTADTISIPAAATETTTADTSSLPVVVTETTTAGEPTPEPVERSITVGGIGRKYATPDRCVLSLGVHSRRDTVLTSARAASAAGEALVAALLDEGVLEHEIQTADFSVEPYYTDYPAIGGYETRIGYNVVMPDVDRVGSVLKAAITAGGDDARAWGIRFEADTADLIGPARQIAWADAEARARHLAELIGEPVGVVLDVHEKVLITGPQGMVQGGEGDSASFDIPASPGVAGVVVLLTVTFSIGN